MNDSAVNFAVDSKFQNVNWIGQEANRELEQDVAKLWDLETLGIIATDQVHEKFLDTIELNGSRYSVKLPWKVGHRPLLLIILTYLSHQAVVRSAAEATKLRVLYDASAKEGKSGVPLNNCLHVGPPLNPFLFDIMLRFREKEIGITADIEKAFLDIEVDKEDRDCWRFLWLCNVHGTNQDIKVYHFNCVVFGVNCSPFLLNAVLRYHLSTYKEEDPEFSATLSKSFYVDYLLCRLPRVLCNFI